MEKQIKYVQVTAKNETDVKSFESLMYEYIAELNEHDAQPIPAQFQHKWINSIITMQGPKDRHLELCYIGEVLIGFLYGKIDHKNHKGFIKPGYGYIMEFYVKPHYRRSGYGKRMFRRMEQLFQMDGAKMMYLTADPVTGKPFWDAVGFLNTNEKSPENKLYIYEKAVSPLSFTQAMLVPLTEASAKEISKWEYETPYEVYNFKGYSDDWLMDKSTWGTEQFCLVEDEIILGQVACQFDGSDLWVGWSMIPQLCGKGYGSRFVERCVEELHRLTKHTGRVLLRVAAWNQRAIRAYQQAGFSYMETIQDEIAYTNYMEDFWVMELL